MSCFVFHSNVDVVHMFTWDNVNEHFIYGIYCSISVIPALCLYLTRTFIQNNVTLLIMYPQYTSIFTLVVSFMVFFSQFFSNFLISLPPIFWALGHSFHSPFTITSITILTFLFIITVFLKL